jgi:hypothetical protein
VLHGRIFTSVVNQAVEDFDKPLLIFQMAQQFSGGLFRFERPYRPTSLRFKQRHQICFISNNKPFVNYFYTIPFIILLNGTADSGFFSQKLQRLLLY